MVCFESFSRVNMDLGLFGKTMLSSSSVTAVTYEHVCQLRADPALSIGVLCYMVIVTFCRSWRSLDKILTCHVWVVLGADATKVKWKGYLTCIFFYLHYMLSNLEEKMEISYKTEELNLTKSFLLLLTKSSLQFLAPVHVLALQGVFASLSRHTSSLRKRIASALFLFHFSLFCKWQRGHGSF